MPNIVWLALCIWRGIRISPKTSINEAIEAIPDFNEAIQLDPQNDLQNAFCFRRLAMIYWRKGDFDKAISNYNQAIRKISLTNNKSLTASYLHDRGGLYERMGYSRAEAYQENGNYDLAIADYNKILGSYHRS